MSASALDDLDGLLAGAPPGAMEAGSRLATLFLDAGVAAWGASVGKTAALQDGAGTWSAPAAALEPLGTRAVVCTMHWGGEREGDLHLVLPETAARALVAHFLALAMGTVADPDGQALDEEGMDACRELMNTAIGQAGQALRAGLKSDLSLSATSVRIVDFAVSPASVEFGSESQIAYGGSLSLEGEPAARLLLLIPLSVTGIEDSAPAAPAANATMTAAPSAAPEANRDVLLRIKLPIVVVLASKRERMETIQNWGPGAIIEFRKHANELLDLCAGSNKIAEGEVVVTNEHFGMQIRKLIDWRAIKAQAER